MSDVTVREARDSDAATIVQFNAAMAEETEDKGLDLEALSRGVARMLAEPARGFYLIAERFHLTQQVGEYKKANDLPPADPSREGRQIERLRRLATDSQLDPDFAESLIRFIIDEVIRNHERIRAS